MSKYTPSVDFKTDFEDDEVSMKLFRLKRKHYIKIVPYLDKAGTTEGMNNIIDAMCDFLPNQIEDFIGPKGADGESITLETVMEDAYFIPLLSDIVTELFLISSPNDGEIKKSENTSQQP